MSDPTHPDDGPLFDPFDLDYPEDIHPESIELEKIPRRLWQETLAPLHRQQRMYVALQVRDERLREAASTLAYELDVVDMGRRNERHVARGRAKRAAAPLPSPPRTTPPHAAAFRSTSACAPTTTRCCAT